MTQALIEWAGRNFAIDADRLTILGHSRGGGGVYAWTAEHPQDPALLIVMGSGLPRLPKWKTGRAPGVWMLFGEHDLGGDKLAQHRDFLPKLEAAGVPGALGIQAGGNHMSILSLFDEPDFWNWIAGRKRPAR